MFTVKTPKGKDLGIKVSKMLENQKYDSLIAGQEYLDKQNQIISESASNLRKSKSFKNRRMLQERSKQQKLIQDKLFMEAVYTVFYNALMLDESVKERHDDKLYKLTEQTVKSYLDSNNLQIRDLKKNNGLLENLISLCEEIAQDEVKERFSNDDVLNELDDEEESTDDVKIDSDNKEAFDREVDDVTSNVVDDIKSRVLETIEREKQIATDKQEMEDEIEIYSKQISDSPEVTTAGSMTGTEENTDDTSDSEETVPEGNLDDKSAPATNPKPLGESSSVTFEKITLTAPVRIKSPKRLQENTLFGSILKSMANKATKEATLNESAVNMDLIFSESVMMLTLFESLQLLGITNYSVLEMKQFGRQLVMDSKQ